MDILYEDYKYRLPESIKEGDKLLILSTGAYTTTYSAVYFNGFPPLRAYVVKDWTNCKELEEGMGPKNKDFRKTK